MFNCNFFIIILCSHQLDLSSTHIHSSLCTVEIRKLARTIRSVSLKPKNLPLLHVMNDTIVNGTKMNGTEGLVYFHQEEEDAISSWQKRLYLIN